MHAVDIADAARPLIDARAALEFIRAGNARFTLASKRTGTRFTYRVRRCDDADKELWFVSLLTGADNEASYAYLGTLRAQQGYAHGRKSRVGADAPGVVAFAWAYDALRNGVMPAQLECWHEGRCGRCGRALTVPESLARGLGPECAGRAHPWIAGEAHV